MIYCGKRLLTCQLWALWHQFFELTNLMIMTVRVGEPRMPVLRKGSENEITMFQDYIHIDMSQ